MSEGVVFDVMKEQTMPDLSFSASDPIYGNIIGLAI